jgi:hypothetical protein
MFPTLINSNCEIIASLVGIIDLERRKHLKILESAGFLKQLLLAFVEEFQEFEKDADNYLIVKNDSIHIKPEKFGLMKIESDNLNASHQYFELLVADEDRNLKTVIVENFLATRFDVDVEELILHGLDGFRVVKHQGYNRVAVIVNHPRDLLVAVVNLILFCNVYIDY